MPTTPNYGLYYPANSERPAVFPAAQQASQTTLDTLLKQISDSIPAGDASTLNSANEYTDQRTPQVTIDTSAGTCVRIGGLIVAGTTGPRNITTILSYVTAGRVALAREANLVTIVFDSLTVSGSGWTQMGSLPIGFRPTLSVREDLDGASNGEQLVINAAGNLWMNRSGSFIYRKTITYVTAEEWPSSLPGDPA